MRLWASTNRVVKGTTYYRYRIDVPPSVVEGELHWKHGQELKASVIGGKLVIERVNPILAARARLKAKARRAPKTRRRSA